MAFRARITEPKYHGWQDERGISRGGSPRYNTDVPPNGVPLIVLEFPILQPAG